jgi:hypothetical protein
LYLGTFKIFIFVDSCKLPLIFKWNMLNNFFDYF